MEWEPAPRKLRRSRVSDLLKQLEDNPRHDVFISDYWEAVKMRDNLRQHIRIYNKPWKSPSLRKVIIKATGDIQYRLVIYPKYTDI